MKSSVTWDIMPCGLSTDYTALRLNFGWPHSLKVGFTTIYSRRQNISGEVLSLTLTPQFGVSDTVFLTPKRPICPCA
jgi:hypothetical protein